MIRRATILLPMLALFAAGPAVAERPASLRGSPASMQEQNRVARDHGLSFYRTAAEIRAAVLAGELVALTGNADYSVAEFVKLPYLHPAAALFVERLASQYREACGQKLVVTSAVRAQNAQPSNAHALSVHPAAMAVDLRVSDRAECRAWLENAILNLERQGVINGIREFHPPHYHIAVYPTQYLAYAETRIAAEAEARAAVEAASEPPAALAAIGAGSAFSGDPGGSGFADVTRPDSRGAVQKAIGFAAALVIVPFGLRKLIRRRG